MVLVRHVTHALPRAEEVTQSHAALGELSSKTAYVHDRLSDAFYITRCHWDEFCHRTPVPRDDEPLPVCDALEKLG